MTRHRLSSVAAIAFALGVSAAGAQNVDQRRNAAQDNTDQGKQTDQIDRNQPPQNSGQSRSMPQQRSDQDNQQGAHNQPGTRAPQQSPPSTTGQNAPPRQQDQRQPEQGLNQQQGGQQRNAPATNGRSQQGAGEPQQGQTQQQGAENEQPDISGRIALNEREQTRVSDIIRQQRIQPVTNLNFSLSVAGTVPSSVRLSRISGELADIFPPYRDFSFFVAKQELVIVDPQSYAIVAFVPIGGGTIGVAPPRENSGAVGGGEAPAPAKKKAARTEKKRVTDTEEKPRATERETTRRRSAHTETDVTVGASRRDIDEREELPPRDRDLGPPVRKRFEHNEGPPFPFSLFFGGPR
jgi:hypothetical protein